MALEILTLEEEGRSLKTEMNQKQSKSYMALKNVWICGKIVLKMVITLFGVNKTELHFINESIYQLKLPTQVGRLGM